MAKNASSVLLHGELSYQIIGACFDVFNEIGAGHKEEFYQRALAASLRNRGIAFAEQVCGKLVFEEKKVGLYRLDFIVENRVVVEIKALEHFRHDNYRQVKTYLTQTNLDLGLLIRFSEDGVTFQRVLKPYAHSVANS